MPKIWWGGGFKLSAAVYIEYIIGVIVCMNRVYYNHIETFFCIAQQTLLLNASLARSTVEHSIRVAFMYILRYECGVWEVGKISSRATVVW